MLLWMEKQITVDEPEIKEPIYLQITGLVNPGCAYPLGDWNIYLEHQIMGSTEVSASSDSIGNFWFFGKDVFTTLDTSSFAGYRIVAVSPLNDTLFSGFDNLTNLALMSFHHLDCTEPITLPELLSNQELGNEAQWEPFGYMGQNSLNMTTGLERCEVSLRDMSGRLLLENTIGQKHSTNVAHLSSGIYILRFVNPETNEVRVQKIWKNE